MRMTFGGSLTLASFNIHQRSRSTGERELTENITNKFQSLQSLTSLISLFMPHTDTKQWQALTPYCLSTEMQFWVMATCQSDRLILKLLPKLKGSFFSSSLHLFIQGVKHFYLKETCIMFFKHLLWFLPSPVYLPVMSDMSSQVGVVNSSVTSHNIPTYQAQ